MTADRKKQVIKGFEDLDVFRKAYRVSLEIHQLTLQMPREEQYGLADQLRRTSKAICANLAEGFGKQSVSKVEFKRFVLMAMGSADEMRVWLRYCLDLGYVGESQWKSWRDEYQVIAKMLTGMRKAWE